MGIGMNFGIITQGDITTELISRGITVGVAPPGVTPIVEPLVTPLPVLPPPEDPEQPITVLPRTPVDYYEPYIPIYPPPTVTPEDVTEEILPYDAEAPEPAEKKGLNKGLLIIIGITAFALMTLAKPKAPRGFTRRRF